ncbi:unnamed protein product [Auanema sp. JU1783]|nr:unnamed protein product [Auanema sp. JU1783]
MTCLVSLALPAWLPLVTAIAIAIIIGFCVIICYISREIDRYKNFYGREDRLNSKYEKEFRKELEETEDMIYRGYKNEVLVIASPGTQSSPVYGLKVMMTRKTSRATRNRIENCSISASNTSDVIQLVKDKLERGQELIELLSSHHPLGNREARSKAYVECVRALLEKMTLQYFVVYGKMGELSVSCGEDQLTTLDVAELSLNLQLKVLLPQVLIISAFQIHPEVLSCPSSQHDDPTEVERGNSRKSADSLKEDILVNNLTYFGEKPDMGLTIVPALQLGRRRSTRTSNLLFRNRTSRSKSIGSERRSRSIGGTPRLYPPVVINNRFHSQIRAPSTINATSLMYDSIDITISLRNLSIQDLPTEVICILWANETENDSKWTVLGTSEPAAVIKRNVFFSEKFTFDYKFEKTQLIKVEICRVPSEEACSSNDVFGTCMFKVDELIGSFGLHLRRCLQTKVSIAGVFAGKNTGPSMGGVLISGQMGEREQPIVCQFEGKGIDRKDFLWDETAVFFRVYRLEEGEQEDYLVLLYESEAIKNHSHPVWSEFALGAQDAADNRNRLLEVRVWYRDVDGSEGYIGKFLTTYAKMKYGPGPDNIYHIINETKKQQKKNYEHSGKMELVKFTDVSFFSFLDYIVSGTQLHFELAVDFSSDEGKNRIDNRRFDSDFQISMRAIGSIIRDYSPNKLFAAFGVGAKIPPTFHESHEFHLNFALDPACRGLDGVMDAYRKAESIVTPIKDAKFAPIIQYVTRLSQQSGFRGLHYHIFTIFARSPPVDMKDVIVSLQAVAEAPLSIVFIGIGSADFTPLMKLASKRKDLKRDCVEYCSLSELFDETDSVSQNKSRIAEQALHNIPQHMVSYMHMMNVAAKPPIQVCRSPLFHSSSLIPDRPTQFTFIEDPDQSPPPPTDRLMSERRGSDSHFLDVDNGLRTNLTVRIPERCHSVLQTSREQYQRRLKERGLARMRFPRMELTTLESSGSTQDSAA